MEQERTYATTGVLGMNLCALGEEPLMVRVEYFLGRPDSRHGDVVCRAEFETATRFSGDTRSGASVVQRKAYGDAGVWKGQARKGFLMLHLPNRINSPSVAHCLLGLTGFGFSQ